MGRGPARMKRRSDVARIDLKYVQVIRDKQGRTRHYYRRPGVPRLTLPGEAGSAAFMAAYAEAQALAQPDAGRRSADHPRVQPRSIDAMVIEYYRSTDFLDLAPASKTNYRRILDGFRANHGSKSAVAIQPHHLNAIFHSMSATPEAARNLRKRLLKAFATVVDLGWRSDNPVRETSLKKRRKAIGHIPWSEQDIAAFVARWAAGTRERLALYLLLYTGVRRSDVVTLGRQLMEDDRIRVVQEKTDVPIWLSIHPVLKAELALHPKGMTFLLTQYGQPFSPAGFTNWFVARAKAAGLDHRTPHGLRKALGRRLAEADATSKEIAGSLGQTSLGEVETYTRDADQRRLADSAMKKLIKAQRPKRERGV